MKIVRKTVLTVVSVGVLISLAIAAFGWRRYASNRPPAPSEYSIQLASKMTEASFQSAETGFRLPYRLHVPPTLQPGRKYPLIVYLHGGGDNGSDNVRQVGPIVGDLINHSNNEDPAFILAPQAPWGQTWVKVPGPPYLNYSQQELQETDAIKATRLLVLELPNRYPIDTDRLYVIGFSAGAAGSWELLTRTQPHPFAAGAVLSGAYDPSRAAGVAGMPLWLFHGDQDTVSPYTTTFDTAQVLSKSNAAPRYTLFKGIGHDTGKAAFDEGVYAWLLGQRRSAWDSSKTRTP